MCDATDDLCDDYNHVSKDCFYIVSRIAGPDGPTDLEEQFAIGCSCPFPCNLISCTCQPHGINYEDVDGKRILSESVQNGNKPIGECHNACQCFCRKQKESELLSSCRNRLVQFGPLKGLEVFKTLKKGFGLKTIKPIYKNQFICEYAGEVIGEGEAIRRIEKNKLKGLMNYVFILKEHGAGNQRVTCFDPEKFGNLGRYINHSCSPNAIILPVRISSHVPLLCIFAAKKIEPGEEITFDYCNGEISEQIKSDTPCYCSADNCRLWLPGCISS